MKFKTTYWHNKTHEKWREKLEKSWTIIMIIAIGNILYTMWNNPTAIIPYTYNGFFILGYILMTKSKHKYNKEQREKDGKQKNNKTTTKKPSKKNKQPI